MKLIRSVTKDECPWLDSNIAEGTEVFEYLGCTYGCCSPSGVAVTLVLQQIPFFELPLDALAPEPQKGGRGAEKQSEQSGR